MITLVALAWLGGPLPMNDAFGDPLPPGALARLGSVRFQMGWLADAVLASPDGSLIACLDRRRRLWLFEAETGKLKFPMKNDQYFRELAFSADGKTLVSVGNESVQIWDVADGKCLHQQAWMRNASIFANAFSPVEHRLAWSGEEAWPSKKQFICLWDWKTGKELRIESPKVRSLAFSPDGKLLAAGDWESNTVKLWQTKNGKLLRELVGHKGWVTSVAFSPAGDTLASACGDKQILLWNVADGKLRRHLHENLGTVPSVFFSPNGEFLGASGELKCHVWSAKTGKKVFQADQVRVERAVFSSDSRSLITGSNDIRFWNLATGKEIVKIPQVPAMFSVVFLSDGEHVLSDGGLDGIHVWHVSDGKPVRRFDCPNIYLSSLCVAGNIAAAGGADGAVHLWNVETGKKIKAIQHAKDRIAFVAISPDGRTVASSVIRDTTFLLWDTKTGKQVGRFAGHTSPVIALAFSPKGDLVASSGDCDPWDRDADDRTIRLWKVETGEMVLQRKLAAASSALCFSPDGKLLAFADAVQKKMEMPIGPDRFIWQGTGEYTIHLMRISNGKDIQVIKGLKHHMRCLSFSADGRYLAGGGGYENDTVRVWEVATGRQVRMFQGQNEVCSIAFSPDGKKLASTHEDSTTLIWDLESSNSKR